MGVGASARWLMVGLFAFSACVEQAKSADVPPELAPSLMSSSANVMSVSKAQAQTRTLAPKLGSTAATSVAVAPSITQLVEENATSAQRTDAFFGEPDRPALDALATQPIASIEKGRGGRSLGFRITLEGGQKGYFKAEQVFSAANWFGEVAGYHLDRMLGLGRVPPVVSRQFSWARLEPIARGDWRKSEIIVRNGQVRGAFVGWVTGNLRPMSHQEGWERWVRVKYWPSTAISPFQRPAVWKQELDAARSRGTSFRTKGERFRRRTLHPEPDRPDRPAELSDLMVFDFLTRNLDRWGGGNANVLVRGDKGPLVFLDNSAGFEPGDPRPSLMEARLHVIQRFRRGMIEAIRAFDVKKFEARLAKEPMQPVLTRMQLAHFEQRRRALLEWVSEMEKEYGEAIWAWE
jgi:hypothetical protein